MLLAVFLHFLSLISTLNAGLEVSFTVEFLCVSCIWWLQSGLAVEGVNEAFPSGLHVLVFKHGCLPAYFNLVVAPFVGH